MATEAQKLITISMAKIAQSRSQKGGVSLHKNLLVATVLQKARYIFMEEAYHMVHSASNECYAAPAPVSHQVHQQQPHYQLVALTAEEAGVAGQADQESEEAASTDRACNRNQCPSSTSTYLDLDKPTVVHRVVRCLKRRRVGEWETEEAVQSILPKSKRTCCDSSPMSPEDCAAVAEAFAAAAAAAEDDDEDADQPVASSMEIDRITSLVSIFSFGAFGGANGSPGELSDLKLTRSVSTPDLCSAQAKEGVDSLQQQPFLAMTV